MKRVQILSQPVKMADFTFDDMYYELSRDWQQKARLLRVRRWRALKQALRGDITKR